MGSAPCGVVGDESSVARRAGPHPREDMTAVDKMMLERGNRVNGGKRHCRVGKNFVHEPCRVLLSLAREGGRNAEPAEDADWLPVRGRDQITADHEREEQRI